MSPKDPLWAHSANVHNVRHTLVDHLRSTALWARRFAEPFGGGDLAWALGLCHDAGKASCAWQRRLLEVEGTDDQVGIPHKQLGARMLQPVVGSAAAAIYGHHGGLPDSVPDEPSDDDEHTWRRLVAVVPELAGLMAGPQIAPPLWRTDRLIAEMGIRLVFSALVDADHLDTGAHERGLSGPVVRPPTDMAKLAARFEARRAEILADPGRVASPIDGLRSRLYQDVVESAVGEPGIYRLPAPTGSGKTITAAGFALHHAKRWGKARVIVAVPFITITEQNAKVYRKLLDAPEDPAVLEHHSNVNVDRGWQRAAVENWDAPFVITTTVQLFESLFGRRPSRSRKLHRLANAVIVLDEVQALPLDVLVPVLDALRILSCHFGTTVLLASATQPPFHKLPVWGDTKIKTLVTDPANLFVQLRRVRYEWRPSPPPSFEEIAAEIAAERQVLAVVNTVADARRLYRLLLGRGSAVVRHLSTRMCPVDRQRVLDEVRALLANDRPVQLVSTQLIEAGVDVDFPVVYRALAPADSLQQAAGRANREGRLPGLGRVVVFDPLDGGAPPSYRTATQLTAARFGAGGDRDPDNPELLEQYYQNLYAARNLEQNERTRAVQHNRRLLRFESVADGPPMPTGTDDEKSQIRDRKRAFRMLDDDAVPIVVPLADDTSRVRDYIDKLRQSVADCTKPAWELFRALQPFTVQLPRHIAHDPAVQELCAAVAGDLLEWRGEYDRDLGLDEGSVGADAIW